MATAPVSLHHNASTPPLSYPVRGERGVCSLTGYSPAFVYRLIETGQIPVVRVGRSVRVLHDDLVAFLDAHRVEGAEK